MRRFTPLRRIADVRAGEGRALGLSFLYFLLLLTSYYVLRPIRDERGVAAGVGALPRLFTATFAVMLVLAPVWSALVARVPRSRLLPIVYRFFVANLLVFYLLFVRGVSPLWVGRVFFVWLSVFNMLAVSVFWGFMADLFRQDQGKRLFGLIAAGGSAGAMLGPLLTSTLVARIGPANLLLVAAALLEGAARCIGALVRDRRRASAGGATLEQDRPVGGGALSGIRVVFTSPYLLGIATYVLLANVAGTFGYFLQSNLVAAAHLGRVQTTALFARVDLGVNALAAVLQALVAGPLITRAGIAVALAVLPPLSAVSFATLAASPTLLVSSVMQVFHRAIGFGIANPAVHALYTVVDGEQKYKSKAFIETAVVRGGDWASAWAAGALIAALGVPGTALAAAPIGALWVAVAVFVGRRYRQATPT